MRRRALALVACSLAMAGLFFAAPVSAAPLKSFTACARPAKHPHRCRSRHIDLVCGQSMLFAAARSLRTRPPPLVLRGSKRVARVDVSKSGTMHWKWKLPVAPRDSTYHFSFRDRGARSKQSSHGVQHLHRVTGRSDDSRCRCSLRLRPDGGQAAHHVRSPADIPVARRQSHRQPFACLASLVSTSIRHEADFALGAGLSRSSVSQERAGSMVACSGRIRPPDGDFTQDWRSKSWFPVCLSRLLRRSLPRPRPSLRMRPPTSVLPLRLWHLLRWLDRRHDGSPILRCCAWEGSPYVLGANDECVAGRDSNPRHEG